ncbi:MAG: family 20 glycosylhydrolase [Balneolaceae bacterium]|nr:family 20 glycosylhydrolase [Balneolaceae bacterium]
MNFTLTKAYLFFTTLTLLLIAGCSSQQENDDSQYSLSKEINHSPIEITWNLISNFEENNQLRASLAFRNTGSETFTPAGWTLYLNSIRVLDAESFLPEFEVTHISGDFFKLEPTDSFNPIPAGEEFVKEYKAQFHAIKKTDAPQGFYFVYDDRIEEVTEVSVEPFVGEEQVNRNQGDNLEIPTAGSRYRENEQLTTLTPDQVSKITPTPSSLEMGDGSYELTNGITISYAQDVLEEAEYLSSLLSEEYNIENTVEQLNGEWNGSGILLNLDPAVDENEEAYSLQITDDGIELSSSGNAGIFYAIQSLRSLISNRDSGDMELAAVQIFDQPGFDYRGMHLDVARNFQDKESVLRLLEVMGMYKLNKFHFHLTDDEGWRLAIDELPELTEVGGRRGHTETEEHFLAPSYGSGPDPTPGESFGSGWYSRDEYIEILQFAGQRHIEVIPEIDVPGHARAAIKGMEVRFNRLSEFGESEQAEMYRLADPADESEYMSVQNFDDNVMNVCRESTYNFMGLIFDEVIAMHEEAGVPLNMIHVGGDEVPEGAWTESPACDLYMEEHSIDKAADLFGHFFTRLESMLEERGLQMAGWEEVGLDEDHSGPKEDAEYKENVVPYVWSSIWGSGREDYAYMLANAGYNVVMSNASNLYLDMAYNKSWQEPGFYWAAMFDTKDTYSFIPYDLYKNAEHDNYGNPVDPSQYDDAIQLSETGRSNILGIQGQLWSETVNEPQRWEYMVLPRLLGLAERAWVGNPSWGEMENLTQLRSERDAAWNEFANRVGQYELDRLDNIFNDINYRLPVPGAVIEDGVLMVNSAYPGLEIRYEINGTPNSDSPIYQGPVEINEGDSVTISIFNSAGRSSRKVSVQ